MWTEEREAKLLSVVGPDRPVTQATVAKAAEALDVSARSAGSKLRKMGVEVEKAGPRPRAFSDEQEAALVQFLTDNEGEFTYAEIAEKFAGGKFTSKQIQGKVLSLELTGSVKPTPKKEAVRTYTPEEEATFVKMAHAGKFLEDIAAALNKTVQSVRGKALSLTRTGELKSIPAQRDHVEKVDVIEALGDITALTVEEIAEKTGKTVRGIKTIITRRGLECANYKAKAKKTA